MKTLKAILAQGVDLILLAVAIGLIIWYAMDPDQNFTGALVIYGAYVSNSIRNKVQTNLNRKDICKYCGKAMKPQGHIDYLCMNPYCDNYITVNKAQMNSKKEEK